MRAEAVRQAAGRGPNGELPEELWRSRDEQSNYCRETMAIDHCGSMLAADPGPNLIGPGVDRGSVVDAYIASRGTGCGIDMRDAGLALPIDPGCDGRGDGAVSEQVSTAGVASDGSGEPTTGSCWAFGNGSETVDYNDLHNIEVAKSQDD